ncbi:MAG: RluA family pseudouridine synthase, partial [Chloroflexi bacterium]|nr:RluA family pseudouridine synthase [Chloroflexota bacterium]
METVRTIHLVVEVTGVRLDRYVCQSCQEVTRSQLQKFIEDGRVTVNGRVAKSSFRPKAGDVVAISLPPPSPSPALIPQDIPLDIVYEDSDVMVVDKPAGITVYPAPGHPHHTLMNAVVAHCPEITSIDSSVRPGIVHRLDKDTSGLMVIAK